MESGNENEKHYRLTFRIRREKAKIYYSTLDSKWQLLVSYLWGQEHEGYKKYYCNSTYCKFIQHVNVQTHMRQIDKEERKNKKSNSPKRMKFTNRFKNVKVFFFFLNQSPCKFILQFKKKIKWSKHPTSSNHSTLGKLRKLPHEKADFYDIEHLLKWKEERKIEGLEKNLRYEQRILRLILKTLHINYHSW